METLFAVAVNAPPAFKIDMAPLFTALWQVFCSMLCQPFWYFVVLLWVGPYLVEWWFGIPLTKNGIKAYKAKKKEAEREKKRYKEMSYALIRRSRGFRNVSSSFSVDRSDFDLDDGNTYESTLPTYRDTSIYKPVSVAYEQTTETELSSEELVDEPVGINLLPSFLFGKSEDEIDVVFYEKYLSASVPILDSLPISEDLDSLSISEDYDLDHLEHF